MIMTASDMMTVRDRRIAVSMTFISTEPAGWT
jgi:hypothetical protein